MSALGLELAIPVDAWTGGADRPWETVTIGGREYVLVATPYSE